MNPIDLINNVILGDVRDIAPQIPDNMFQAIITSPPYFGHRTYSKKKNSQEIGQEGNVTNYVEHLVDVFSKLMSKLKDDGLLWLNLGDTYRDSNLLGIPWRVALALKDKGWLLRSDVIWYKPNAMPSSIKTRPTPAHEYVFMFAKSSNYYYDADSIREPHVTFSKESKMKGGRNHFGKRHGTPELGKNTGNHNLHDGRWDQAFHPLGRNKRTLWEISLSKFKGTHFAVFPEKLVETCLRVSTKEDDLVLDPFCGSGTTGAVALRHGRRFVGIELVEEYRDMSIKRLLQASLLSNHHSEEQRP